jgi:hypothetical protein
MRPYHAKATPRRQPPGEVLFMIPASLYKNLLFVTFRQVKIQKLVSLTAIQRENTSWVSNGTLLPTADDILSMRFQDPPSNVSSDSINGNIPFSQQNAIQNIIFGGA